MNSPFDELTRSVAQSVTRRGALKRCGLGLAGLAMARLGLQNAQAISLGQLAPFAPLPPEVLKTTDILHITRTWTFTRADQFFTE